MRTVRTLLVAVLALAGTGLSLQAQASFPVSLFERYAESLRQKAGIPGMSAAILQHGQVVWDKGFGHQDVARLIPATADTPYPILGLSQALSSTLLLQRCVDQGHLELSDRVRRWDPAFPDDGLTVEGLLSHTSASGDFEYDTTQFALLTRVIEQCADDLYPRLVAAGLFDRLGMARTVPGADLGDASAPTRSLFSESTLARYADVLADQALPYQVDGRGPPIPSAEPDGTLSAANGVVSTVRDLARFDAALDDGILLADGTRGRAWTPVGTMPTGLGWFVEEHRGERLVWQFGLARDAYSGLVLKVPGRGLTLILLANSDGLAGSSDALSSGSVTDNLFASLFLGLFVN